MQALGFEPCTRYHKNLSLALYQLIHGVEYKALIKYAGDQIIFSKCVSVNAV